MRRVLLALWILTPALLVAQTSRYRDLTFKVQTSTDLTYGSAVSLKTNQVIELKLDLYAPIADPARDRPAVVLVHGGGFTSGSKNNAYLQLLGRGLASRGYVAVSIDYRLLPSRPTKSSDRLPALYDMKAAVRFVRRNAASWRVDPDRVACLGSSAGAFLCLETAYGTSGSGNSGNPGYRDDVQVVVDLWGALGDVNEMQVGDPPLMIVHGTRDTTVPFSRATALYNRVRQLGIPHEYYPIQNAGHAPWSEFYPALRPDLLGFLFTHLKLDQKAGLQARAGYSSPGTLHLDGFGARKETALLFVSLGQNSFPFLDLGVFCLDTSTMLAIPTAPFDPASRQPLRTTSFSVPGGHTGLTLYWQEIRADFNGALRTVTNCVRTTL